MLVCPKCKKELVCKKNGTTVRYRESGEHCYAGDLFQCPTCGFEVVNTRNESFYDPNARLEQPHDVWMDVEGKGYEPN